MENYLIVSTAIVVTAQLFQLYDNWIPASGKKPAWTEPNSGDVQVIYLELCTLSAHLFLIDQIPDGDY